MRRSVLHAAISVVAAFTLGFSIEAQVPAGYYDSAQGLTGTQLEQALHEIIDDHTRYPYTSTATDTWDILHDADEDAANPGNVLDLYRNRSFAKLDHWSSSNTAGWNREHSWPKSYGFSQDGTCNYPYTDTHHLFASDGSYNSARSNIPYNWAPGGTPYPVDDLGFSNWKLGSFSDGSWEVWEYRKGDVARAAFYMAVRYEGGTHGISGCSEPDLRLTDDRALIQSDSSNNLTVAYMGILSTLLEWHQQDPVDERERRRNDVVYGYQGNRNPFIDHPEWACEIFPCTPTGGNQPPIADFSFACDGLDCSFTDASSDPDGTISSWAWDFGDGTTSTSPSPAHSYASEGTYTVTLTVTDNGGATDAVSQSVTASSGPPAGAFDLSGWKLTQQNFTYELVFPAGTMISEEGYLVIARSASQAAFESFWGVTLGQNTTFLDSGNSMPVINGDEVYALYDATGALVDGTTIALAAGQSVQRTDLCASASSPSSWSVGPDSSATPGSAAATGCGGGIRINEFSDASGTGNYVYEFVELHFDSNGSGGGPTNQDPVAAFTVTCNDLECSFTDASSDSDGSIVAWDWSFGDGGSATTPNPVHAYSDGGTFTVILTVTDDLGATAQSSQDVTVSAPVTGIQLFANPYKVKGKHTVDLTWSGATTVQVEIRRDGAVIATTTNDGAYTDAINDKGAASYTYLLCETGTGVCSSPVTVVF